MERDHTECLYPQEIRMALLVLEEIFWIIFGHQQSF
jgi:hypothetical protein